MTKLVSFKLLLDVAIISFFSLFLPSVNTISSPFSKNISHIDAAAFKYPPGLSRKSRIKFFKLWSFSLSKAFLNSLTVVAENLLILIYPVIESIMRDTSTLKIGIFSLLIL